MEPWKTPRWKNNCSNLFNGKTGWCSTPPANCSFCLLFSRENGHLWFICSSLSTAQERKQGVSNGTGFLGINMTTFTWGKRYSIKFSNLAVLDWPFLPHHLPPRGHKAVAFVLKTPGAGWRGTVASKSQIMYVLYIYIFKYIYIHTVYIYTYISPSNWPCF